MAIPEEPQSRVENYLGVLANQLSAELPDVPQSRIEEYLQYIIKHLCLQLGDGNFSVQQTNSKANGDYAFAEGYSTEATGESAHAEGRYTHSNGKGSHAEGAGSVAIGDYSHAEGWNTYTKQEAQHVEGRYNLTDEKGKYAHIVGNGVGPDPGNRSNAHTVDWDGNAWFAGSVEGTELILKSSTSKSKKRFKITVNDSGEISAEEI